MSYDGSEIGKVVSKEKQLTYERDPKNIYAKSFKTVQNEGKIDTVPLTLRPLITRLIHSCGMLDIKDQLVYSDNISINAAKALKAGANILCDCEMVSSGIIRRYLPANNKVIVTLNDPKVIKGAQLIGNTRSAAAVQLWEPFIEGAVVAIGNAPTALFHLLELLDLGFPKPACILGFPVGFVGAMESKLELELNPRACDFITLKGRRGGSAMASAAVNALAAGLPEVTK
jgi:precorrin-8X/cobalt-precorrin-8 methylmutase